jgi:hypothetical protein
MARIFFQKNRFKQILPSSFHEGEFERIITLQAPFLYPDYYVIPFKKTVSSPHGNSKPDLVFIAKDYKDWYVVEVEMTYHNFSSHIEPQMRNLSAAIYDDINVVNYICQKNLKLDTTKASKLIHDEPVKLLLILNEFNADWAKELSNKYSVITSAFNVFQNNASEVQIDPIYQAFMISRNYPIYSLSAMTKCSVHPHFPYLGVDDNSSLQLKPGDEVILEYENCVTFWKATQGPGKPIWLKMNGRDEFVDKKRNYQITKLRDNSLLLNII